MTHLQQLEALVRDGQTLDPTEMTEQQAVDLAQDPQRGALHPDVR
jgi:hypothetical protein